MTRRIQGRRPSPARLILTALLLTVALAVAPRAARAQAIERNLPAAPAAQPQAILPPNAIPASQDDRPIGVDLIGLVILGPQQAVVNAPVSGVDAAGAPRLDTQAGRSLLRRYLGRPLSRKRIAQIETAIARYYRARGFAFVSLSTPPQVIGGGVLQIRVVEFRDGAVTVSGVGGARAQAIRDQVRLQPDQPIDTAQLSEDLDWLNRYPFTHVEAVFSPGDSLGKTDLDLQVTPGKPWQVYAGYANSGSASSTFDRYLIGGKVGGLLVPGSQLSYQFTASADFFDADGRVFGAAAKPSYLSHGLRASVPVGARQQLEATFDFVETNETSSPFAVRQTTDELTLGYRGALSNVSPAPGDISLGIELKHERHQTFFGGAQVLTGAVDIDQFYTGWSFADNDRRGRTALDLVLHFSPGGLGGANSNTAFSAFTNGRVSQSSYDYANVQLDRHTRITPQWTVSNLVIAQVATKPLPDTEQMGVGGADLVRGYTLDDGAFDQAVVARNELRLRGAPLLSGLTHTPDSLSPFAFVDAGYGADLRVHRSVKAAAVGLGADYQVGSNVSVSLTGAFALANAERTRCGDGRVDVKVIASF